MVALYEENLNLRPKGEGDYFVGFGKGLEIPRFFRTNGIIENLHLTKPDI